jgi:hypothetical protein
LRFIESRGFTRIIHRYLDEDAYVQLQVELARRPDAGDVIPGSGGVRKLRWTGLMTGKRGGLRVIYLARVDRDEIWMLAVYAKSERVSIPAHILLKIRNEIHDHDK